MKIKINITKQVLQDSMFCLRPNNKDSLTGQNCAIGKAIFALFGNISWVCVDQIKIFKDGAVTSFGYRMFGSDHDIELPKEASEFIKRFDNLTPEERIEMEPFNFEIDVPNEVIDLVGIGQVYKVLSESKTLELAKI